MHVHAYVWLGETSTIENEALRRMPDPPRPPATWEEQERYREAAEAFRRSEVPPMQTAHWLRKTPQVIRATFEEPEDAAAWLMDRLAEHAPGFLSPEDADPARLGRVAASAEGVLAWGGDVSLGFYVGRSSFLSLALVTCSPNRAAPGLPCPRRIGAGD